MPDYKVWDRCFWTAVNAPNEEAAMAKYLDSPSGYYARRPTIVAKPYPTRPERDYWHAAWDRALKGMAHPLHCGPWGALARALGNKIYSSGGHYNGHAWVYNNWCRGSKPKNPWQAAKLLELADMY